ncbi:MAG: hypothetical protein AABP62_24320 [Planctomycetota bacterium]
MKPVLYGALLVGFSLLAAGVFRVAEAQHKCAGSVCSQNGTVDFPSGNKHCGFDTTMKSVMPRRLKWQFKLL